MIRTPKYLIFLFPLIFLPGCFKQQISVLSNTFVDQATLPTGFPDGSSFFILAVNDTNKLLSKEICLKIQKMLLDRGFTVTEYQYAADYQLTFDYRTEEKKTIKNVPFYIPGQTATTYGSAYGNNCQYFNYNETTQTSGSFIYIPKEYTYYIKVIYIKVQEQRIFIKNNTEIWNGASVCSSENADPRYGIDHLLVAVFKNFGYRTQNFIKTKFNCDDDAIKQLQNIK